MNKDLSNYDKQLCEAHFISFLFYYYCKDYIFILNRAMRTMPEMVITDGNCIYNFYVKSHYVEFNI